MATYGLSQNKLALALHVSVSLVNRITNNKLHISAEMALRLGRYFGTTPEFWLNLQMGYDLRMAQRRVEAEIEAQVQPIHG